MKTTVAKLGLLAGCLMFVGATQALAQDKDKQDKSEDAAPGVTQIVALDECDPATFNANPLIGADFCKNVTLLPFRTQLMDLFSKAAAGTPDPGWDFEPDAVSVKKGSTLVVVNQGGEPHTFTEVARFGGGFIDGLNAPGEATVNECKGGFSNVAVAKTRILQGSQSQITGLSKGTHLFECCIHPWMRMTVEVK